MTAVVDLDFCYFLQIAAENQQKIACNGSRKKEGENERCKGGYSDDLLQRREIFNLFLNFFSNKKNILKLPLLLPVDGEYGSK